MANKISMAAANAFNNGGNFHLSNTAVFDNKMLLWGNRILWKDSNGATCFSLCGWDTKTTCERLRAAGLPIHHKKGQLYFGDYAINDCACYVIMAGGNVPIQL